MLFASRSVAAHQLLHAPNSKITDRVKLALRASNPLASCTFRLSQDRAPATESGVGATEAQRRASLRGARAATSTQAYALRCRIVRRARSRTQRTRTWRRR
jgi:hypothetical protein